MFLEVTNAYLVYGLVEGERLVARQIIAQPSQRTINFPADRDFPGMRFEQVSWSLRMDRFKLTVGLNPQNKVLGAFSPS